MNMDHREKPKDKNLPAIGGFRPASPFFLAPMAGFTDGACRRLAGEMGAALTYTEMVSAKGLYYRGERSYVLLDTELDLSPVAFQLFGSDPDILAFAAEKLRDRNHVLLDVNMGCPVPKVVKNGEGSALLRDPELIYRIIRALVSAAERPVTAKIRIGIEGAPADAAVEAAQAIEAGGGAAVAVHGRTREQYYTGKADLTAIRRVKESVGIPVIGNGDIASCADAERMLAETGCDYVMIGRAALGNPWFFRELNCWWEGREQPEPPDVAAKKAMMIRHYRLMEEEKGEYAAVREMRKFVGRYTKGLPGSAALRGIVNAAASGSEFCRLIEERLAGTAVAPPEQG